MNDYHKVIACLKEIGFKPNLINFEDRLIVQKTIYLLQLAGVKTGFKYSMYVRGPYSPDLTKVLYQHQKDFKELAGNTRLNENELQVMERFKELLEMFELKAGLLEVAATYAFLRKKQGLSAIDALREVKKIKPFLSETQIALGISLAKLFVCKPTRDQVEDARKEFRDWELASIQDMQS